MDRNEIFGTLSEVFREVFDDDTIVAHSEMTARDVPSWDSLSNIRMIVAVEETLRINFSTAEITDLKNVGALVDVIARKLGNG